MLGPSALATPHQHMAQVESARIAFLERLHRLVVVEAVGEPETLVEVLLRLGRRGR